MFTLTSVRHAGAFVTVSIMACAAFAQAPPPSATSGKSLAASAGVFAYPAKGQKADKQAQDEAECYNWSKQQSGYDPLQPPPAATPAQDTGPARDGSRARGAARGAVAGAVIGEVAGDDAGKGAAVGAVAGTLAGGRQSRMAQSEKQQQAEQEAKAQEQAWKDAFKRGMAVCLEARGYTVK
jgi:hypothetical protein